MYEATNAAGDRAVAKLIPKQPGAARELLFEDLAGARNVVPILDRGEDGDNWVLVMPRSKRSLADRIRDDGPLSIPDALIVVRDVTEALEDLQDTVVHRDIKPDNILLLDGRWCLADFGIARYAEASTAPDTRKHALSPQYASPEQWAFQHATPAADVYALGGTIFAAITGTPPFPGPRIEDYCVDLSEGQRADPQITYSTRPGVLAHTLTTEFTAPALPKRLWWFGARESYSADKPHPDKLLKPDSPYRYQHTFGATIPGWCYGFTWLWPNHLLD